MKPLGLASLCHELRARGWHVTRWEWTPTTALIGFDFMPLRAPSWLKAFELAHADATVEGVEHAIETWRASVRHRLENGEASATVRKMLAEHGPEIVREAMGGYSHAA